MIPFHKPLLNYSTAAIRWKAQSTVVIVTGYYSFFQAQAVEALKSGDLEAFNSALSSLQDGSIDSLVEDSKGKTLLMLTIELQKDDSR